MSLSLERRRLGDITVVKCSGRIVEGPETVELKQVVLDVLQRFPHVILDVGEVQFVDSAGLGLLVRLYTRAQTAHGGLKLCGVSPRLAEVLKATRLDTILESHPSEDAAVAAFYQPSKTGAAAPYGLKSDILCVDTSDDVVAYVRELLGQAGYGVTTANNIPDALILLKATRPKLIVTSAALRAHNATQSAETFNRLASAAHVVEIPVGFSSLEAGEAGRQLLERVQATMGGGATPAPA